MGVFIRWSGKNTKSYIVATILRDWLQQVIQGCDPWVSDQDIDVGTRWSTALFTQLDKHRLGIICVTKQNQAEPWLNFEAGGVSSISSSSVRVDPKQERSARRLAGFLQAAAELFSEIGFEATTMQAIADRSNSSIGALYNYFPDKQSVAATLLSQYAEEWQWRLKSLMEHSEKLSTAQFAGLFIDCIIEFAQERPAYLSLHTAPIRFRRDPAARKALRTIVANAFRTKNPSLSSERSLLAANVAVQIVKGMITLFLESDAKTKPLVGFGC